MKHLHKVSVLRAQVDPEPDPDQEEQERFFQLTIFRVLVAAVAVFKGI